MIFSNSSNEKKKDLIKVYLHDLCMDHSARKLLCKNSKMINLFHNHLFFLVVFLVGINSFSCEGILRKYTLNKSTAGCSNHKIFSSFSFLIFFLSYLVLAKRPYFSIQISKNGMEPPPPPPTPQKKRFIVIV